MVVPRLVRHTQKNQKNNSRLKRVNNSGDETHLLIVNFLKLRQLIFAVVLSILDLEIPVCRKYESSYKESRFRGLKLAK